MVIKALLKIIVIRGKNLAVRDFFSSDPYVKLRLMGHEVKTRTIYQDLNPEWNEELTLGVPDPPKPLELRVYDKDMVFDDKMGDAVIDLRPLIAADKLKDDIKGLEDGMILHRVVANNRNNFTKDSIIKLKGAHVVQEVSVRLQNVEKGTLKLELKLCPLRSRSAQFKESAHPSNSPRS